MEENQKFVKVILPEIAEKYGKPNQIFAVIGVDINGDYILLNSRGIEFVAPINDFEEDFVDTKAPHYNNWLSIVFPTIFKKQELKPYTMEELIDNRVEKYGSFLSLIKDLGFEEKQEKHTETVTPESQTLKNIEEGMKNIASYNDAAIKQMMDDFHKQPMVFVPEKELKDDFSAEDLAKLKIQTPPTPEKQPLNLNKVVVDHIFSIRSEGDYAQKGFYLHPDYNYKIVIDNQNKPVLLLLEK